jgi:arylsulfatase A
MRSTNINFKLISILVYSFLSTAISTAQIKKPNIIYILTDDLGYGDIRYLNKDSKIHTPNLDALAKDGMYFTDAHSNSSVCTPTRYGILTGRYAFRSSLKRGVLHGYSPSLIEKDRPTVASFLQKQGYYTACIGKWHLGLNWAKKNTTLPIKDARTDINEDYDDNVNYNDALEDGPLNHGFDYSFIIPASLDMSPYLYIRNNKPVNPPTAYTAGKSEKEQRGIMRRPGKMSPDFNFEQVLPNFINDALVFIEEREKEKPFFLYLALPSPHTPWVPTEEFKNSKAGVYGNYVTETDYMIGKILAALKKNQLEENTLVIVTSDNGADWKPTDIEATGHKANYIFRGRKADIYEAGHRVPFIAKWPTHIKKSSSSDQLMCTTDLFATVAGILKQPLPSGCAEDSENMLPAFTGKTKTPIREAIIHHSLAGIFSIRQGNWKLTTLLGSGGFTDPRSEQPTAGAAPMTLYDLKADIAETKNLYYQYPERIKSLKSLLDRYIEQGYSRATKN